MKAGLARQLFRECESFFVATSRTVVLFSTTWVKRSEVNIIKGIPWQAHYT